MTGTEYLHLGEGDKLILTENIETYGVTWEKGDIIEVVFFNRYEESVIFKNLNIKWGNRQPYKSLGAIIILKATNLYKKANGSNITTFEHKFKAGDTVWRMNYNKPESHIIDSLQYTEYSDGSKQYNYICNDGLVLDDSCEIYGSKDELLDSLR